MKFRYLWAVAVFALILQGCTKSAAEKDYIENCTQQLSTKICSCSYDLLEKAHGEDSINAMYKANKMTPRFKRDVGESLMYCNDLYREN